MPTLTIPNRELHLVQLLARKLTGNRRRTSGLTLVVRADGDDLVLEIARHGYGVRRRIAHRSPNPPPQLEPFTIPLDDLADAIRAKSCEVRFDRNDDSLTVSWTDHGVPRQITRPYVLPESRDELPQPSAGTVTLAKEFAEAFTAAAAVTSKHSARYAIHCVSLDGRRGRLAGTDGVQAYAHSGFDLPWETSVLVPASIPLGHASVRSRQVEIGGITTPSVEADIPAKHTQIMVRSGDWTFWVPVQSGVFPDMDRVIPQDAARTRLALDRADALKLTEQIDGLPGEKDSPVTVCCDDLVTVRSELGEEQAELRLIHSRTLGFPAPVCMKRSFLKRAASLGFDEIGFHGDSHPAVCRDDQRTYIWMTLDSSTPPRPAEKAGSSAAVASTAHTTA